MLAVKKCQNIMKKTFTNFFRNLRRRYFSLQDHIFVLMWREWLLQDFIFHRRILCKTYEYRWMFFVLKYFPKMSKRIKFAVTQRSIHL